MRLYNQKHDHEKNDSAIADSVSHQNILKVS